MKTFKEILTEHWRKSPGYKVEDEADFAKTFDDSEFSIYVGPAIEEYAAQFKCKCKEEVKSDPSQIPLFHHTV